MSWQERIKTDFIINTGDGKQYTPKYLTASVSKNVNFNVAEFIFKKVRGTLVYRGQPRGTQYDIEIIFEGDDNLDVASDFQKSAENPNYWSIRHPVYDWIYVQPLSLTFDNSKLNTTVVRGVVVETILGFTDTANKRSIARLADIPTRAFAVNTALAESFAAEVPVLDASTLNVANVTSISIYDKIKGMLNSAQDNAQALDAQYNAFLSAINAASVTSQAVITAAEGICYAPANFVDTVANRIAMAKAALDILQGNVDQILSLYNVPTKAIKKFYEAMAGACVTAACTATTTNITTDYNYRVDVIATISSIVDIYNGYLYNLDSLQSDNGGSVDSYIPAQGPLTDLAFTVHNTISALFAASLNAKQERIIEVAADTNVLLLAYELYGMTSDDSTIDTIMRDNNIGLSELLVIEKGRMIKYYV